MEKISKKYSLGDYINDNPLVLVLCLGFSILLLVTGIGSYNNGDYSDASGIWWIDGILSGIWLLAFTIDYFRMKKLAKKGLL